MVPWAAGKHVATCQTLHRFSEQNCLEDTKTSFEQLLQ